MRFGNLYNHIAGNKRCRFWRNHCFFSYNKIKTNRTGGFVLWQRQSCINALYADLHSVTSLPQRLPGEDLTVLPLPTDKLVQLFFELTGDNAIVVDVGMYTLEQNFYHTRNIVTTYLWSTR